MSKNKGKPCYYCGNPANSREHIPPKSLFPKAGGGRLLTVPACSLHNSSRSQDDEYVATVLAMNSESDIAFQMFKGPRLTGMRRNNDSLGKRIFSDSRPILTEQPHEFLSLPLRESRAISYELERIDNVMVSIARGLYHYEKKRGSIWKGDCTVHIPKMLMRDLIPPPLDKDLMFHQNRFLYLSDNCKLYFEKKGFHTEIFYYQFADLDKSPLFRLVFYSNFEVYVFMKGEEIQLSYDP
jgi:hypothetical protein